MCRTGLMNFQHENVVNDGFHHAVKLSYEQLFPATFYIDLKNGSGKMSVTALEDSLSLCLHVDKDMRTLYKLVTEGSMVEDVASV